MPHTDAMEDTVKDPQETATGVETAHEAGQDPDLIPISRYLGVTHVNEVSQVDQGKIEAIAGWVRTRYGNDTAEVLYRLRQVEQELDPPPIGVSRLDQLYQWVKLDLQEADIKKRKQQLQRHG